MASGSIDPSDEFVKAAVGEITSFALPGLQTAFRFAVALRADGDPLQGALGQALQYRFAAPAPAPDAGAPAQRPRRRLSPLRLTDGFTRSRRQKKARKEAHRMAERQGLDVSTLIAASADRDVTSDTGATADFDGDATAALVPLQFIRVNLAYSTRPLLPAVHGWREDVATALTRAADAGLERQDERSDIWKGMISHSLGVSENWEARTSDWGRLVAAAFEYELRKVEDKAASLSAQLDRADSTARFRELALAAARADRSLSGVAAASGVIALMSFAAVVLLAMETL